MVSFGLLWCQTPSCNYCKGGGGRNAEGAEGKTSIGVKATLTLRQ